MSKSFGATFSAPDMRTLLRAIVDAAPYAREAPAKMRVKLVGEPVDPKWLDRMLAGEDGVTVEWGRDRQIGYNTGSIAADFPDVPVDPAAVLAKLADLPFELCVFSDVTDWAELDYYSKAISADHALLGWGMAFKGAGHERSLVSRRWLEHGPFRVLRGANDTTLVQFHDLAASPKDAIEQARPGHEWLAAGFLRAKHRYKADVKGVYTRDDGLLRVVVDGREVTDAELVDACAARRDGRNDPAKPIANVAYVFVEEKGAKARLDGLWLRELECRVVAGGKEKRLDEKHAVKGAKPAWARKLGS